MKLKSIITLIIVSNGLTQSVSELVNQKLECGKPFTDFPPPWLFIAKSPFASTTATVISANHIITSSSLILTNDLKYRIDGSPIQRNCIANSLDQEIDLKYLPNIKLNRPGFISPMIPKRVLLPKFCEPEVEKQFGWEYSPMIIELETTLTDNYICLNGKFENQPILHEWVYISSRNDFGNERQVMVLNASSPSKIVLFDEFRSSEGGGILIDTVDGKVTLIGVKTMNQIQGYPNTSFKLEWLLDSICSLIGLCVKAVETTTEVTTEATTESSTVPPAPSTTTEAPTTLPTTTVIPTSTATLPSLTSSAPREASTVTQGFYDYDLLDDPDFMDIRINYRISSSKTTDFLIVFIMMVFLMVS